MSEQGKLLGYYDYWVNGVTLSHWRLLQRIPSSQPAGLQDEVRDHSIVGAQFSLTNYDAAAEVALAVDPAKLKTIYQILLHGSQATGDTCEFSDVDVLVVIDDSHIFTDADHRLAMSGLQTLLKSMFLFDPLMHHGFMFMLRSTFTHYDEAFLPVETLRRAKILFGPRMINVRTEPTPETNRKTRLKAAAASLNRRLHRGDLEKDDYACKSVLSGLLLMPSLLLESINVFRYKRESFSIAPREFAALDWSAIRHAEDLRLRWKRPATVGLQHLIAKVMHPHAIIRLSHLQPPKANVTSLFRNDSDAFKKSCKEFLDCIAGL